MSAPAPAASASSGSKRSLASDADSGSEQRRVQLRREHDRSHHDRARSNGAPQLTASSAADANAQPPRAPAAAAAVTLHLDALESIFAFLDLSELAAALRVASGWLVAVDSMRRLELEISQPREQQLVTVARSAMGRHVTSLGSVGFILPVDAATLSVLADRMAHLRALSCRLRLPPPGPAEPLAFPSNLRRLGIDLASLNARHHNAAVSAISRLPLLDELDIELSMLNPQFSFAPLAALPRLRCLNVWGIAGKLSDAQVDQLRALPHLQELNVEMSTALLRRLLRLPHSLQWQQIWLPWPLEDEFAALLPQLPSLTKIKESVMCDRFDWLRGLPNLTEVQLSFDWPDGAVDHAESLVAALQCCTKIEVLLLGDLHDLTAAQLGDLLPRLPRLRELTLKRLLIDSLSFLAQPPLTSQLRLLRLRHCTQLPLLELRHVQSLRGLRQLELCASFTAPLDEYSQSLFRPPSLLLPLLEKFDYVPPVDEEPQQQGNDYSSEDEDGEDEDAASEEEQ